MPRTILYHVTFAPARSKRLLHIWPSERFVACTKAIEDPETVTAYHLDRDGKHLRPDYEAIREAIPYVHRKAYDRANKAWWFPATLHSALSGVLDQKNACSKTLYDRKGKLLGTLYATPYLFDR